MTDRPVRLFSDDATVRRVGAGFLARTLTKAMWTHEAHLGTCAWLILERPDVLPERDLPGLIRAFNESVGGVNDDTQGYHETLTQLYIRGVRLVLAAQGGTLPLVARVNALLTGPVGERAWPLEFYSRERLFSPCARRAWIEPDLRAISF